jgi:AcrR family transcriptional regulator
MTRSYRLGKRAAQQAETRARIVAAALGSYRDRGFAATSLLAVAKAAEVAPATVRNHFPDTTTLAVAAGEAVLDEMRLPDASIFDGTERLGEGIERLAVELAAFSDRGETWWFVMQREPELAAAWSGLQEAYESRLDHLMRAALGSLGRDDLALAVVAAVIGPPTFYALRGRGLTSAEAVETGVALVVPWLEARAT